MNPEISPTARALLALELIQGSPGITADRLADKLGVSDGPPGATSPSCARRRSRSSRSAGRTAAIGVGRGLRLPPLAFSAAEALGLVMAVLDGHHDGERSRPTRSAARSARSCGAAGAGRRAGRGRPTDHRVGARPCAARPDPATTIALVAGLRDQHRRARLDYRSEAGSEWVDEVEPWAVVVRHARWSATPPADRPRTSSGSADRPARRRPSRGSAPSWSWWPRRSSRAARGADRVVGERRRRPAPGRSRRSPAGPSPRAARCRCASARPRSRRRSAASTCRGPPSASAQ